MKINNQKILIAGPCSAESLKQLITLAECFQKVTPSLDYFRAGIWKPRTKPNCFQGIGNEGFKWLNQIKNDFGFKTATEVGTKAHVQQALQNNIDLLWIGAKTITDPFAIQSIADTIQNQINTIAIKNPIYPDIQIFQGAIERLLEANVKEILVVHRGFFTEKSMALRFEPRWDIINKIKEQYKEVTILLDPSHISGDNKLVKEIYETNMYLAEGVMVEVHPNPLNALSDKNQQIDLEQYQNIFSNFYKNI